MVLRDGVIFRQKTFSNISLCWLKDQNSKGLHANLKKGVFVRKAYVYQVHHLTPCVGLTPLTWSST